MSWKAFATECPELAQTVAQRLNRARHLTMATVRADGSPRISGTEIVLTEDQLYLAGMTGARRFADLRANPGVAIHSPSADPPQWSGDAKVSGVATELRTPEARAAFVAALDGQAPPEFELFAIQLTSASTVQVADSGDHLVIQSWAPGQGVRTVRRD